jgi:arabinofuranosyltransferase
MSGRFYALPIFMAIIVFVRGISSRRAALVVCGLLAAYLLWSPISAVKFGTPAYRPYPQHPSYIDTKWYVFNEGAALLNFRPGTVMPDHDWYKWGAALRDQPQQVLVGGAYGGEAIGYVGFAAGPEIHFIDVVGLSDPLLARLPTDLPTRYVDWKSGHFHRQIPDGYIESIESGENAIHDPQLREYYEVVRQITRAPVWSLARFSVIVNANLGRYNRLIPQQAQTTSAISE